jgi:urease gamma subunit
MSCREDILGKYKEDFSGKDIDKIMEHAEAIIRKAKDTTSVEDVMKYVIEHRKKHIQAKNRYLKQVAKGEYMAARIDEMFKLDGVNEKNAKDIAISYLAYSGKYQQENLESAIAASYNKYMNALNELEKTGDAGILRDKNAAPDLHKAVSQEVWHLSNHGKNSPNVDARVKRIADIIHGVNKQRLADLQAAGFDIEELKGYVFSGSYDPVVIRNLGIEKFTQIVFDHMDVEETAKKWGLDLKKDGDEQLKKMIADIYQTVSTKDATFVPKTSSMEDLFAEIKNPSLFNNSVSRSRSIAWRDGESFYSAFSQFTNKNLMQAIHRDIRKSAKAVATANTFGTSPSISKEFMIKHINKNLIENGQKPLSKTFKERYDSLFDYVSGNASYAESAVAVTAQNLKKFADITLLGKAAFKALFSDPTFASGTLSTTTNNNMFTAWANTVYNFIKIMPSANRKLMSQRAGALMKTIIMEGIDEKMINSSALSRGITRVHDAFMKYSGIEYQSMTMKQAVMNIQMQHMHDVFTGKLDATWLKKETAVLQRYGFTDTEISLIGQLGIDKTLGDGQEMITVGALREALPDDIRKLVRDRKNVTTVSKEGVFKNESVDLSDDDLLKIARKASDKYAAYLHDISMLGSPNPTKATKFLMSGMTDPNTTSGALMSLMTMYKGFALSIYRNYQHIAWHSGVKESNKLLQYMYGGRGAIVYTMLGSVAAGGASLMMTDILDGKTPRDPTADPFEFFKRSFMAGGAGGLLMDYMLEDYDQGKKDLLHDLAGPVVGRMLPDIGEVYKDAWKAIHKGDMKPFDNTLINLGRWVPAQNLWLTRVLFGNMLLDKYREWADPKFNSKRRKIMKKASGELWDQKQLIGD